MADNYTDNYNGIAAGQPLSAQKMTDALNTREKVDNKKDTISNSSTEYPSAKAVYDLNGTVVHKAGVETITGVKTFGTVDSVAEPKLGAAKTTEAANDGTKFATEAQVYNVSRQIQILPIGTILMYDGTNWTDNNTLPGWYSCISANAGKNCPNLVGSFIKGTDLAIKRGAAGNSGNTVTIGANNLPEHTHSLSGKTIGGMSANATGKCTIGAPKSDNGGWAAGEGCLTARVSGTAEHGNFNNTSGGYEISIDVSHTHSFPDGTSTSNNATTASALNIEPQSYALIYIRRCA